MTPFDQLLLDPDFARDPFPVFAEMRKKDPMHWSDAWQCWVLTRYDDVREALQDFNRFSNRGRITGLFHGLYTPGELEQLKPLIDHYTFGLINDDPPNHTRMRRVLHVVFKPSVIAGLRDRIRLRVDELFDAVEKEGRIDFVRQFSHPLPVQVIAETFGVPRDDVHLFVKWSHGIVEFQHHAAPPFEVTLRSQNALIEMRAYLREQIALRRSQPGEDVLSLMVRAESEGDKLTEEEILGTSVTILNGGHETTTRLLATAVVDLCRHPTEREKLRASPELIEPAVEEFLRFSGPFQRDARVCLQETVIRGKRILPGQTLLLLLGAANRDPGQFPDAENFDITRTPNKHVAFGYGPHICLGAPLARLETSLAINTLLHRFPEFRLEVDSLEWSFGFVWGPREVPLSLR
jgi:cytochrome P450